MRNERGTILVEFVGSFLLFVLLIMSILSLVNIVTLQARMNYAITQTANSLSMYGYVLNVVGLDKTLMNVNSGANVVSGEINSAVGEINDVLGSINSLDLKGVKKNAGTAKERFGSWTDSTKENPKQTIQLIVQYGLNEGEKAIFEQMLRPLMLHYLANGDMSGEDYLKSMRVNGDLEFYDFSMVGMAPAGSGALVGSVTGLADNDSILLDEAENVKITVRYEVDYSFMGLPLPFDAKLKITQSVITKMWLGGSGDGYVG